MRCLLRFERGARPRSMTNVVIDENQPAPLIQTPPQPTPARRTLPIATGPLPNPISPGRLITSIALLTDHLGSESPNGAS